MMDEIREITVPEFYSMLALTDEQAAQLEQLADDLKGFNQQSPEEAIDTIKQWLKGLR